MEQYSVYDHKYPPKNRCESRVVRYVKDLLAKPVDMTIEQVRDMILDYMANTPVSWGTVTLSEIEGNITIVGTPWICQREFRIHTTGRKAASAVVQETIMKDSTKNFAPVKN